MPIHDTSTRHGPQPVLFRDFARLCNGIYSSQTNPLANGFSLTGGVDRRASGFQGGLYHGGQNWVLAIAGTQVKQDLGVDAIADAGFGQAAFGAGATAVFNPLFGGLASAVSVSVLEQQCQAAAEMVARARQLMRTLDNLYIAGHSLGGGVAQIVSARTGVPAVAISSPAVTGVDGVSAAWARSHSPIVCLRVRHDPVNQTHLLGDLLGRVVTLESNRRGLDAHSIEATAAELSAQGAFSGLGARNPFTV